MVPIQYKSTKAPDNDYWRQQLMSNGLQMQEHLLQEFNKPAKPLTNIKNKVSNKPCSLSDSWVSTALSCNWVSQFRCALCTDEAYKAFKVHYNYIVISAF